MRINWRTSTWGDEISLEYGKALRFYHPEKGEYRVYGSNGPIGWTQEPLTQGPGVILGRKGAYRGVEFSKNPFWVIDTAYYVSTKSDIDIRWLYYAIKHHKLGEIDDGSPIPSTTRSAVYVRKFEIPSKYEQVSIARILGSLDDKIELNRKANETLEAMARTLFQAWFVDFEPVRAKMEGRWGRGQSLPGLPAHLYDMFPDRLVESELGEIPKEWHISKIGDEVSVYGGGTPSTKEPIFWQGGTHYWATPKDLSSLKTPVLMDTERKITDEGLAKIGSGLLPQGTVLLSSRAPIGYLAITEIKTAVNQGFIAMVCKKVLTNLFSLFWCHANMETIVGRANGSTFQEISKSNFREIPVIAPSPAAMDSFQAIASPIYRQLVKNEKESNSLAQLRDTLLPRLLSGELRVPEAERLAKEVL